MKEDPGSVETLNTPELDKENKVRNKSKKSLTVLYQRAGVI
jgi:hypothetical protein